MIRIQCLYFLIHRGLTGNQKSTSQETILENYPGRDMISDEILFGVDPLPSEAMGYDLSCKPLLLPKKEILDKKIG